MLELVEMGEKGAAGGLQDYFNYWGMPSKIKRIAEDDIPLPKGPDLAYELVADVLSGFLRNMICRQVKLPY